MDGLIFIYFEFIGYMAIGSEVNKGACFFFIHKHTRTPLLLIYIGSIRLENRSIE